MIVTCEDCNWGECPGSEEDVPSVCPNCGGPNLAVQSDFGVPDEAREEDGAVARVEQGSVFPSSYPAPQSYSQGVMDMSDEDCLQELADMGVDFDWVENEPIPCAIVLPRPVFILGIRLKYNASGRPDEDWEPPEVPSEERAEFDLSAGPQRRPRRGRLIDVRAALAQARFFNYLTQLNVKQVDHAGIYPGRGDINNPRPRYPHVWGKAVDYCWFYISSDGRNDVTGLRGLPMGRVEAGRDCPYWGPLEEPPRTPKQRFLREIDTVLRSFWNVVVSPDDTSRGSGSGNHTTHFHVDVHDYGRST